MSGNGILLETKHSGLDFHENNTKKNLLIMNKSGVGGSGSNSSSSSSAELTKNSGNNNNNNNNNNSGNNNNNNSNNNNSSNNSGNNNNKLIINNNNNTSSAAAATTTLAITTSTGASNLLGQQHGPTSTVAPPPSSSSSSTSSSLSLASTPAPADHCRLLEEENQKLKESQTKLQQQCTDAQRRERILMRRLANKEQEFQDYISQIAEYKAAQAPAPASLRSALLDPAVNLLFEKLKKELQATKAKLEETQNELSAWKFTPDSNTGKRLMAKCRLLYQENEELGKMTSNGRLAKLEGELAMQKGFSEEVKKSQSELDDFLQELDEDVEGMQSTILLLQQELKTTRDRVQLLEKENFQFKNGTQDDLQKASHFINGKNEAGSLPTISDQGDNFINNDESKISNTISGKSIDSNEIEINGINNENVTSTTAIGHDSGDSNEGVANDGTLNNANINKPRNNKKLNINKTKRPRRASVLSTEGESVAAPDSDEEDDVTKIITRRKSARNQQNGSEN